MWFELCIVYLIGEDSFWAVVVVVEGRLEFFLKFCWYFMVFIDGVYFS